MAFIKHDHMHILVFKALLLSMGSKKTTTVGEMVNLLAVDAQKIQDMVIYSNCFLDIPLHVIFGMFCIWLEVGWACLAGIGVLAILLPLNIFVIAHQCQKLQVRSCFVHCTLFLHIPWPV